MNNYAEIRAEMNFEEALSKLASGKFGKRFMMKSGTSSTVEAHLGSMGFTYDLEFSGERVTVSGVLHTWRAYRSADVVVVLSTVLRSDRDDIYIMAEEKNTILKLFEQLILSGHLNGR